ncbi:MAG: glycoside-pentoside-hexuronide (GPH):cation symporter [Candidatus Izimaplasma sp.]|nr:glycoside-pentoside-hexuronide (GPH):cation symporter [Candidatus Izimaplasma bacterium]
MENVKTKTKLSFAIGGFGKDMMFAMSTIMMFYFNDLLGINPAFLGVMMMVVRIWDAVNDPIMGTIVDKTKTRWGKFRPWILTGTIINAIIVILLFLNPNFDTNSTRQLVYITTLYTLWGMSYTLMDIPFWSLIPTLSRSQKERESVSVLTRLFTSVGYFIIAGGYISIAKLLGGGNNNSDKIQGLFYLAVIVAIVFIICELITVTNVKEKITVYDNKSLKEMFTLLKQNDQLLVVMIVILIINFTLYITSGMAIYYITYAIGNEDLFFVFIALGGILQVIGSVIYPLFSNKFTRKQIYNIAIVLQLIGFLLLFGNAFIFDSIVLLLFVFASFVFLGQGLFMVLQTVLLSDTVEYGEYKNHKRSESLVFSVQTFIVKMAMGLSLGVIGIGLGIINFVPSLEHADGTTEQFTQSAFTLQGMNIMMFILPIFGLLIGQYIFNKKHIIDEVYYNQMVEELKQRGDKDENTPS